MEDESLFDPPHFALAKDDVPWPRSGHPLSVSPDGIEWGVEHLNKGAWSENLVRDEARIQVDQNGGRKVDTHTLMEQCFANFWDYENNTRSKSIIDMLMSHREISKLIKTRKDVLLAEIIAQATIQWLGTPIGSGFISSVKRLHKKKLTELTGVVDDMHQQSREVKRQQQFSEIQQPQRAIDIEEV